MIQKRNNVLSLGLNPEEKVSPSAPAAAETTAASASPAAEPAPVAPVAPVAPAAVAAKPVAAAPAPSPSLKFMRIDGSAKRRFVVTRVSRELLRQVGARFGTAAPREVIEAALLNCLRMDSPDDFDELVSRIRAEGGDVQ